MSQPGVSQESARDEHPLSGLRGSRQSRALTLYAGRSCRKSARDRPCRRDHTAISYSCSPQILQSYGLALLDAATAGSVRESSMPGAGIWKDRKTCSRVLGNHASGCRLVRDPQIVCNWCGWRCRGHQRYWFVCEWHWAQLWM